MSSKTAPSKATSKRVVVLSVVFAMIIAPAILLSSLNCGSQSDDPNSSETSNGNDQNDEPKEFSVTFADVTSKSTIDATYRNGKEAEWFSMLETLGGGVAFIDFDLNERQDLFFCGGGGFTDDDSITGVASSIWLNQGDSVFNEVAESTTIDTSDFYTHGAFAADFNQDGFPDLLLTGYGGVRLYTNMGDGTFELETESGLPTDRWSTCAAWGDFNGDDLLDVFVVNYLKWTPANHRQCERTGGIIGEVCSPKLFDAEMDALYLGNPDGTFVDATSSSGIVNGGKGLGVVACDIELDGDLDVYVANDTTPNYLYLNDGSGTFEEVGSRNGVAVDAVSRANGSMGVALGDYNNDQKPDIGVANFDSESYALYRQDVGGQFFLSSDPTGITDVGKNYVSWGTSFLDLDADSDEDLIIINGHILYYPRSGGMKQVPLLLENLGQRFEQIAVDSENYLGTSHHGRGLAIGDIDQDGLPDLVTTNVNEQAGLLRHEGGQAGTFFHVRLIGTTSNRDAIGANLELETEQGRQLRLVKSGDSFLSTSQSGVWFGIPKGDRAKNLSIAWPGGHSQTVALDGESQLVVVQSN